MKTQDDLVAEATDQNFIELNDTSHVLLLMFGAAWCPACKMMEPVMNELAFEFDGLAKVSKANVAANPGITSYYGIRNIPTLLIFKEGHLLHRYTGITSKKKLATDIQDATKTSVTMS